MPLRYDSPWRPVPEVELLSRAPITIEDAAKRVGEFLSTEDLALEPEAHKPPEDNAGGLSALGQVKIKMRQLPAVLKELQGPWSERGPDFDRCSECFVEVSGRLEVHMHPCYMGKKLSEGLRRHMSELLLRFHPTLRCMPLAYSELKPVSTHGALVGTSPWVHYLVQFKAVCFAPEEGQWLLARTQNIHGTPAGINLLALGHVSCLVKKSDPDFPSDLRFDRLQRGWIDSSGKKVDKEHRAVWLRVVRVDRSGDGFSLEGSMQWPASTRRTSSASSTGVSVGAGGTNSVELPKSPKKRLGVATSQAEAPATGSSDGNGRTNLARNMGGGGVGGADSAGLAKSPKKQRSSDGFE